MHMVGCDPIGRQTAALAPAFGGPLYLSSANGTTPDATLSS